LADIYRITAGMGLVDLHRAEGRSARIALRTIDGDHGEFSARRLFHRWWLLDEDGRVVVEGRPGRARDPLYEPGPSDFIGLRHLGTTTKLSTESQVQPTLQGTGEVRTIARGRLWTAEGWPLGIIDAEYFRSLVDWSPTITDWRGTFSGRMEVEEEVPTPVRLLAVRITLRRWLRWGRFPKTGIWRESRVGGGGQTAE
jgi:hypothetical protein